MNTSVKVNQNPTVFILDDDKLYLEYISSVISNHSPAIKTKVFSNRNDLIKNLNSRPDLIILDFNLGTEDSSVLTAHPVINQIEDNFPKQAIVLLSGESTLPLLEEYKQYRNLEFLVKNSNTEKYLVNILNKKIAVHH